MPKTKGQRRAEDRRQQRRSLNKYPGDHIGNKVRRLGYGMGLGRSMLATEEREGRRTVDLLEDDADAPEAPVSFPLCHYHSYTHLAMGHRCVETIRWLIGERAVFGENGAPTIRRRVISEGLADLREFVAALEREIAE